MSHLFNPKLDCQTIPINSKLFESLQLFVRANARNIEGNGGGGGDTKSFRLYTAHIYDEFKAASNSIHSPQNIPIPFNSLEFGP